MERFVQNFPRNPSLFTRSEDIGIKGFIMKPFVIHEMANVIRKVMEK